MGSIAKIHEMLVSKQVSCTELTKSYLEEIEKSNGELNAYVNVTPDTALETAKTVDEKNCKGRRNRYARGCSDDAQGQYFNKGN